MLTIVDKLQNIFFVSFGALLGVNIRFILYKKFEKLNILNYYSILIINTLASFFLGLFISIQKPISSYNFSSQLVLFFSIGFLGALSTLSSFVYDLFDLFLQYKFLRALKLFVLSLSLGLIALLFGSLIAKQ